MAPFRAFKPVSLGVLLTFVSVCSLPTCVSAERKNFTVDDAAVEDGEPRITYSPLDVWKQGSDCGPCTAHPDASEALDGTWHDITFGAHGFTGSEIASMDFNGVAVYVFCIVSNSKHYPTSLTFFIDGETAGSYSNSPTSTDDTSFNYNVLVYSNDALESGDHTIEIQNGGQGVQDSVILLDYIVYSQDVVVQTPPEPSPTATQPPTSSPTDTDERAPTSTITSVSTETISSVITLSPTVTSSTQDSSSSLSQSWTSSSMSWTEVISSTDVPVSLSTTITLLFHTISSSGSLPSASPPSSPSSQTQPPEPQNTRSPTLASHKHTATIIAAAVSSCGAILLVLLLLWYRKRIRAQARDGLTRGYPYRDRRRTRSTTWRGLVENTPPDSERSVSSLPDSDVIDIIPSPAEHVVDVPQAIGMPSDGEKASDVATTGGTIVSNPTLVQQQSEWYSDSPTSPTRTTRTSMSGQSVNVSMITTAATVGSPPPLPVLHHGYAAQDRRQNSNETTPGSVARVKTAEDPPPAYEASSQVP